MAGAGYSGTPLWKKLGLKDGMTCQVVDPPAHYHAELLAGAPAVIWGTDHPAFLHVFSTARDTLAAHLHHARQAMPQDGMIWASWPKKAAKVPTDLTEDVIRDIALPMGLVDVKVCAVDATWSGLKLVIRKELRHRV